MVYLIQKKKSKLEIIKLLEYCALNNIKQFDTAEGYNNHKILGDFFRVNNDYKPIIFTKLDSITNNKLNNKDRIKLFKKKIEIIMQDLSLIPNTILFHNISDNKFLKKNFNEIKEITSQVGIKNLGSSIYDLKDFNYLKPLRNITLQVPLSPANLQFKLKFKKNLKIIARSIFLQGLLINLKLTKLPKLLTASYLRYIDFVEKKKINPLNFCMNFIDQQKIDKFIVGVDDIDQLSKILRFKKEKINLRDIEKINDIFSKKEKDPRKWH